MFDPMQALKNGHEKQQLAFHAITHLGILEDFSTYHPRLCGTIPLDIDHKRSDLDIVFYAQDLKTVEREMNSIYGELPGFISKYKTIREKDVLVIEFYYQNFEFQLFIQDQPTEEQYAYLHMVVEWHVLQKYPDWKEQIRHLKENGMKTEPAFCQLLDLKGDPYTALIAYGQRKNYIEKSTLS